MNIQKTGAINTLNTSRIKFTQEPEKKMVPEQKNTSRNLTIGGLAIAAIVIAGIIMRKPKETNNAEQKTTRRIRKMSRETLKLMKSKKINKIYREIETTKGKPKKFSEAQYTAKRLELEKIEAKEAKAAEARNYAETVSDFYSTFDKTKGKAKDYSLGQYIAKITEFEKASA